MFPNFPNFTKFTKFTNLPKSLCPFHFFYIFGVIMTPLLQGCRANNRASSDVLSILFLIFAVNKTEDYAKALYHSWLQRRR